MCSMRAGRLNNSESLIRTKQQLIDQWIHIPNKKSDSTKVFIILHFIPLTIVDHLTTKFNKATADAKQKAIKAAVEKVCWVMNLRCSVVRSLRGPFVLDHRLHRQPNQGFRLDQPVL